MARIWRDEVDIKKINEWSRKTMVEHIGIEFIEAGDDFLVAKMPVDHRTVQPYGLLHGGASVTLAETLGSIASALCVDLNTNAAVGVEINANHIKSMKSGYVIGKVTPIKIGHTLHVWNIDIRDESGSLVCVSRLTCAVIKRR
jgi:1,4-dihydroxy-2-naphthoyl-CoA hydrolase